MQEIESKSAPTLGKILSLKMQVWIAVVEDCVHADRTLPSPDFLVADPIVFANRDDHEGQFIGATTMAQFELSKVKSRVPATDIVLLASRADHVRPDAQKGEVMLNSSLWKRYHDLWINRFSPGTPLDRT